MRKKRLYWLAMVLAVLITTATSSTSDGEDDDMDDDIYVDVQVNADLLNRLLELISNSSSTSTTSTTTTDRPSIKLLIDRSSIQQQQQRPVSLLKLPVILASLNEQSRKLFTNFKGFFIVLLTVLVVLISLTMILILANFMVNKRALCRPATLSRAKKKTTLSFDIIDNGYRQSRPNGLIGNVVSGNNGGIGRFFHRSISTQSNLVVDHDYHFEDFSSFNRTYERINLSSTSNNTTTPTNQAVAVPQTTTTTTSEINNQTSNNTTTNNSQPNKIDELDNFYELPYIDASSTYDFKAVSSSSQESQTNNSCAVAKTPTQLKSSYALLSRQESHKFKTFSSRRFTPNNNEYSNYSNSKQLNNNKTIYPQ